MYIKEIIRKLVYVFVFVFVIFGLSESVSAQTTNVQYVPFCFQTAWCSTAGSGCLGGGVSVHRARLSIKPGTAPNDKALPSTQVYVAVCVSTPTGEICTTGNNTLDLQVYGKPAQLGGATPFSYLTSKYGYEFEGLFGSDGKTSITQPIMSTADGMVSPMEWQDATSASHDRRWLGLSVFQPKPTVDPKLGLGGEQLGTFDFNLPANLKKCIPIAWDPDGVVFDSQSLEPIPGTSVTLSKERSVGVFTAVNPLDPQDVPGGLLTNPYLTIEDGGFSFFVPDGTYRLTPLNLNFVFPSVLSLNPNYAKAYEQIYPALTGLDIIEKGGPQHRDIPVDSKTQPVSNPIKIIGYSYQSDKISSVLLVGRVSHPLSTINVYSVKADATNPTVKTRSKLLTTTTTDKNGRFMITIDQSTLNFTEGEMLGELEAVKNNFAQFANFIPSTDMIKLEPILTYVEGNAYTTPGTVASDAKVDVVLNYSQKPYFETTTDKNGYFKVPSDFIPSMPYHLEIVKGNMRTTVSTSQFLGENGKYLKDNKINTFYPNYNDAAVNADIKKTVQANKNTTAKNGAVNQNGNMGSNSKESPQQTSTNNTTTKNFSMVILIIIIVILLISAGFIAMFFLKKKDSVY